MVEDLKRIVGLKVRAERLARGLTQEQVAECIDRTVETVSNLERGKAWPGLETLVQLCETLKIPLPQLFEVEGASASTRRRIELLTEMRTLTNNLLDDDLEIAVQQVKALANGRKQRDILK